MARMPDAVWQGEHGTRLMSRHDIVCVHTIVGYAPAHAAHFSVKADGVILQSRDTRYQSAANLHGNYRVISIENEDHGPAFGNWGGGAVPHLTAAQVAANAKILRWAHQTHSVPLQLCPNSRPESRGLAYHRQGIDGNFGGFAYPGRVPGGEVWTKSYGKVCPGDNRISQLPDILSQAAGVVPNPGPVPEPEPEYEMPYPVIHNADRGPEFFALTPRGPVVVPNEEYYNNGVATHQLEKVQELSVRGFDVAKSLCATLAGV
jgi:hypothetical protein